ncbi:MAG: O-antigen ligase family protein [Pseudomonadota bacterium]
MALEHRRAGFFFAWISISTLWSPVETGWVSGSLATGDFAIESDAIRVIASGFAGAALIQAASGLHKDAVEWPTRIMIAAVAVQAVTVIVCVVFEDAVLAALAPISDPHTAMPQNIGRNINLFALVLPILIGWALAVWRGLSGTVLAIALAAGFGVLFAASGVSAALVALLLGALAFLVIARLSETGLKWLFSALGASILLAPVAFGVLATSLPVSSLPLSARSRLFAWRTTIEKISENPWTGHGLGATETWRATFSDRPEWLAQMTPAFAPFPIVPRHPHNMPLQIWADTGIVGAVLATAIVVWLGWALPRPATLNWPARLAAAGVFGAACTQFFVSYSVWNEAFWASVFIAGSGVIMLEKRLRRAPAEVPRSAR